MSSEENRVTTSWTQKSNPFALENPVFDVGSQTPSEPDTIKAWYFREELEFTAKSDS